MPTELQAIRYISLLPDVQQSQATEKGLTVLALAMVEGTFTDALGKEYTYDEEWLNAIAFASNTLLAQGREIPFFHSEHDFEPNGYANRNKVGLVRGQFIVQRITPELLPKPEMVEIAGKLGLFTQIEILRPDAIALYQQGLLKAISIGITLADDDYWIKNAVFEISAVAWGAVPQAMLFGRFPIGILNKSKGEQVGNVQKFALTLEGAIAEIDRSMEVDMAMEPIHQLTWAFTNTLNSIRTAPEGELLGRDRTELIRTAIADLNTQLQQALGVTRSAPPVVPVFVRGQFMPLAQLLTRLVDEKATDEMPRSQVIAEMAEAAGISTGTVNNILSGDIDCPPIERLQGFARILDTSLSNLQNEAEGDGCTYTTENRRSNMSGDTPDSKIFAPPPDIDQNPKFVALQSKLDNAVTTINALQAENERMKTEAAIANRFTALKDQARALNQAGKLSKAALLDLFPENETPAAAVAKFTRQASEDEESQSLDEIEAQLKYVAKYAKAVTFGAIATGNDPLSENPHGQPAESTEKDKALHSSVVKTALSSRVY